VIDFKLEKARECGIDYTLNILKTPFKEGVQAAFGGEGFQVGFEAAGVQSSLDALIGNVEKGGEVVILGVYSKNPTVNMYFVGEHELNVFGSMMYRHEDYLAAAALIAAGEIMLEPLISKHFPFDQYLEAYNYIGENGDKVMKVMIDL
jgi:L-iditol 2-dehydrogenase/threonine 3-dehydrogenase